MSQRDTAVSESAGIVDRVKFGISYTKQKIDIGQRLPVTARPDVEDSQCTFRQLQCVSSWKYHSINVAGSNLQSTTCTSAHSNRQRDASFPMQYLLSQLLRLCETLSSKALSRNNNRDISVRISALFPSLISKETNVHRSIGLSTDLAATSAAPRADQVHRQTAPQPLYPASTQLA
jgi:hypothetical protein